MHRQLVLWVDLSLVYKRVVRGTFTWKLNACVEKEARSEAPIPKVVRDEQRGGIGGEGRRGRAVPVQGRAAAAVGEVGVGDPGARHAGAPVARLLRHARGRRRRARHGRLLPPRRLPLRQRRSWAQLPGARGRRVRRRLRGAPVAAVRAERGVRRRHGRRRAARGRAGRRAQAALRGGARRRRRRAGWRERAARGVPARRWVCVHVYGGRRGHHWRWRWQQGAACLRGAQRRRHGDFDVKLSIHEHL
ncbi:hypothetical protein ACQJBY_029104 [Aegilops geniculata]